MERVGYSERAASRRYGLSRARLAAAIRSGQLPAARLGLRRLLILQADLEHWIARQAVRPTSTAQEWLAEVEEREGRRKGQADERGA